MHAAAGARKRKRGKLTAFSFDRICLDFTTNKPQKTQNAEADNRALSSKTLPPEPWA